MEDDSVLDNLIWQRIAEIRQFYCNGNNVDFAAKLGKDPTYTSQLCNGSKAPGKKILNLILKVFSNVSRVWLYFGEGVMHEGDRVIHGDMSPMKNNGIFINHNNGGSTYNNYAELMQIVLSQQKTIQELTEQNKMLTQIIANKI